MRLALTLLAVMTAASSAGADPLAPHRWTDRLVVAIAPRADDPRLAEQRVALDGDAVGTRDRELRLVAVGGDGADAEALRRRFGVPRDAFRAILVGKDGGAKMVSDRPLPTDRLFPAIDAMPMRRSEMARGGR